MVQTNYMQVMAEAAQPRNPLFRAGDVPILFQHLPDLIALSEKLLTAFEYHASQLWRMFCPAQVGPIFRNLEDDLVVFLRYAMHYQNNIKSIRRACNNVLVLKIEQETLSQKDTHRLGIADYLIAPFQRVPRYCLLIKDLLKHTERCDPNYKDLDIALKLLTGLVTAMDYVQETHRIKSTF
ncbi:Dbl homology domain-containing protein [Radiomyces spectabilis]|uniref:Dbl homology domain-containing protein n=1 Tax=Radiomyces spectabilis TaxID=64574 RepID=UPI00221ECD7B|nr:Dbl homology domain-containing protein [Radiomyces spectabilis]KAI8393354.1 Dbl homology domain-containing protein [Radiomyces spectabilis]